MNKIKIITSVTLASIPTVAMAADLTLKSLVAKIVEYLDLAMELLMAFAILAFVYYVVKYFIASDNRAEGAKYVMWSLIGFFVILSVWGLVNILIATFDLGNQADAWGGISSLFPK